MERKPPRVKQSHDLFVESPTDRLSILHLTLSIGETSAAYNELALGCRNRYLITIGTLFRSTVNPPPDIKYYEGDGSVSGFLRVVKTALDEGDYDVVHIHAPHVGLLYFLFSIFHRRRMFPPCVYTVHNSISSYRKLKTRMLLIPNFIFAQQVVCCSKASFASVRGLYRWLAGSRLTYVQNGVDLVRIDSIHAKKRSIDDDNFVVVSVGRLIDIKNPLTLATACKIALDKMDRLLFVGAGPLEREIERRFPDKTRELVVEVAGLVSRTQVFNLLSESDLFVSASYGEGLPVATLEAMASRCPVVLSDIPPHREIVGDADFVPLVHPDDATGFAREIRRFKEMGQLERRAIGDKCRSLVEQHFSLNAMHSGYDKIYHDLIASL